jgi:hypothetical protein
MRHTGYRFLHLDTANHSVWLEAPGMQLDVGGLGKGFVAQAVLQQLAKAGFPVAMVNAGGKIVTGFSPYSDGPVSGCPWQRLEWASQPSKKPSQDNSQRRRGHPAPAQPGWIIGINAPGEKEQLLPIYLSLHRYRPHPSPERHSHRNRRRHGRLAGHRLQHPVLPPGTQTDPAIPRRSPPGHRNETGAHNSENFR